MQIKNLESQDPVSFLAGNSYTDGTVYGGELVIRCGFVCWVFWHLDVAVRKRRSAHPG